MKQALTTKINPSKYNECISWGEQLKAQYLKIQTLVTSLNSAIVNTQKSAPAFQKALDCQTKEECDAITETLFVNEAGQKQYTAFNADITSLNLLNKISSPTISTTDNKNCTDAAKKSIGLYSRAIELNKTTRQALFGAGLKNTPIEALFLQSNQYNKAYDRKWLSVAEKISQNYVKDSESFNCVQVFALNDKIVESGIKTNQNMLDNIGKIQQAIAQKKAGFTCKDLSVKNMTCVQEAISLMDIVNSFDPVPEGHKEAYYKDIIEFANPYKNMHTNTK